MWVLGRKPESWKSSQSVLLNPKPSLHSKDEIPNIGPKMRGSCCAQLVLSTWDLEEACGAVSFRRLLEPSLLLLLASCFPPF